MKRYIVLAMTMALMLLVVSPAYGQGKIKVPKQEAKKTQKEQSKPSPSKQTPKKQESKSNTQKKNNTAKRESTPESVPSSKPSRTFPNQEYINGFTVNWAPDVTEQQHKVIVNLISNMVYINGGTFNMGSNEFPNTTPVHRETVGNFHLGKYEVTQQEWNVIMGGKKHISENNQGGNYPVELVSLYDCQEFINKLNSKTGLRFRIPTEAEWEYAARGGSKSRGYTYSGSDSATSVGWTESNSRGETHPVGQLSPNELGLYDMTGNVSEWICEKHSRSYSEPRNSKQYVTRGGNYYWENRRCSVAARNYNYPEDAWPDTGLRLAITY